ncbi:uncharacterized protein LOC108666825 [Hyalella azteca]|uniref:Uncharacterized protein LOC108666825 n=1 Tax=Hyalella azteca TaxID=294128 RepID=A0A8B7N7I8_HYAAZ|nr:uncharacterized protein LOC108666825 [Hyalella azteca]
MELFEQGLLDEHQKFVFIERATAAGSSFSPAVVKILKDVLASLNLLESSKRCNYGLQEIDLLLQKLMLKCYFTLSSSAGILSKNSADSQLSPTLKVDVIENTEKMHLYLHDICTIVCHCKELLADQKYFHELRDQFLLQVVSFMQELGKEEDNFLAVERISWVISSCLKVMTFNCSASVRAAASLQNLITVCLEYLDKCEKPQFLNLILNSFIEPYFQQSSSDQISSCLNLLWLKCLSSFSFENGVIRQEKPFPYMLLVFIVNILSEKRPPCLLLNEDKLLPIIQMGLHHSDPLSRKQSLHVLRSSLWLVKNGMLQEITDPVVQLAQSDIWEDYFLCYETLEENQIHFIRPVMTKLNKLWTASKLVPSLAIWILVLYKRLFDHESSTVCMWGINHLLEVVPEKCSSSAWLQFIPTHLMPALHNYQLFLKQSPPYEEPSLQRRLPAFLLVVMNTLDADTASLLVKHLFSNLFHESNWEDVSLYYIVASMKALPASDSMSYTEIKAVLNSAQACWSSQEPLLREATKNNLLQILLSQLSCCCLTLHQLCCLYISVDIEGCYSNDTYTWKCLIEKACQLENFELQAIFEGESSAELKAISFVVCLQVALMKNSPPMIDMNIAQLKQISTLSDHSLLEALKALKEILLLINRASNISHLNQEVYFKILQIYQNSLIERDFLSLEKFGLNEWNESLILWISLVENISVLHPNLMQEHPGTVCLTALFLKYKCLFNNFDVSTEPTYCEQDHINVLYLALKILYPHLSEDKAVVILQAANNLLLKHASNWLGRKMLHPINSAENNPPETPEFSRTSKIRFRQQYENLSLTIWDSLAMLCKQVSCSTVAAKVVSRTECRNACLRLVLDWLPIVGRSSVKAVCGLAETLPLLDLEEEDWQSLVLALLACRSELASCSDQNSDVLSCTLTVLLKPTALSQNVLSTIVQVLQQLLVQAEGTRGIASLLSCRVAIFITSVDISALSLDWSPLFVSILVPLLLYGPIPDKKLKALRVVANEIISKKKNSYSKTSTSSDRPAVQGLWSPYHEAAETRCWATLVLLSLDRSNAVHRILAAKVVSTLCERFSSASEGRRTRDFGNSLAHRVKTRALQALAVVLPLMGEKEEKELLQWLCSSTVQEQQQPSVRYFLEWLMALLVIRNHGLSNYFLELCREGVEQRPGCVASFLASLSLLACHVSDKELLEKCITYVVPWCMAPQYNSRLYAQLTVINIWRHCEKLQLLSLLDKFAVLKNGLALSEIHMDDFLFTVFDAVENFTLQTIYYEVPRLSLLSDDEFLTVEEFFNAALLYKISLKTSLPFTSAADESLKATHAAAWVTKAAKVGGVEIVSSEVSDVLSDSRSGNHQIVNMQRKVAPWSSLGGKHQQLQDSGLDTGGRKHEVIVVGSLLNKATNLGGLCRTCEVMGAKLLTLPSLALLRDQAFVGLSLSAHNWIPLVEVKTNDVKTYLRDQKLAGYTIIAVEQTAHSVSLANFSFPARSLLLLGNEREGLPCSLLQEVDACIEIPQFGVTRSLNAHVAGSLCLWQYAQQHNGSSSNLQRIKIKLPE